MFLIRIRPPYSTKNADVSIPQAPSPLVTFQLFGNVKVENIQKDNPVKDAKTEVEKEESIMTEKADLNEELFNKLFPAGDVKSESELKEKVALDLTNMFKEDSNRLFTQTIYDYLMDKTKIAMPENFLKRWIKSTPHQY